LIKQIWGEDACSFRYIYVLQEKIKRYNRFVFLL
jgi:hypothetical protein